MVEGGQDGADEIDEVVTRPGGQLGGEARRQVLVGDAVDADLHLTPSAHDVRPSASSRHAAPGSRPRCARS